MKFVAALLSAIFGGLAIGIVVGSFGVGLLSYGCILLGFIAFFISIDERKEKK